MARPCKSASMLTDTSHTAELAARSGGEKKLRGKSGKPSEPKWLTDEQKKIFRLIVKELAEADILCRLDTWILQECAVAIDCLTIIEKDINKNPELIYSKQALSAKEKYTKILFRCCNELSLSPQSRAKIANISAKPNDGKKLLMDIISGKYDDEGE